MYRTHGDDALTSVGVYLFICFCLENHSFVFGKSFIMLGDHYCSSWRKHYFIDWIMGYQVGGYFLFGKVQQVLHHHFHQLRSFKWEC